MSATKLIISIIFFIVIAGFAAVNLHSVSVYYYDLHMAKQTVEILLILVALIPFILGVFLTWSFTFVGRIKSKAAIGKRNRTIASLEEDLERLKSHTKASESVVGMDSN